jgi:hypothetical protein
MQRCFHLCVVVLLKALGEFFGEQNVAQFNG